VYVCFAKVGMKEEEGDVSEKSGKLMRVVCHI
jgi:hypothetical protein